MRPLLNPTLRGIWRDDSTVQLGADAERAHVIRGLDGARTAFVCGLDGTRTSAQVVADAPTQGVARADADTIVRQLEAAGLLVDGGSPPEMRTLPPHERLRLEPDVAAWSVGGRARERTVLAARRRATVVVEGAGRLGAALVTLLSAAAVGRLVVVDRHEVRPADVGPGGHAGTAVGEGRAASAATTARTCAGSADVRTSHSPSRDIRDRPDLVVLAPDHPAPVAGRCAELLADDVPHLVATTFERVAVVGPLVVPGRTPCVTCLELHRVDRDAGWAAVAAQLCAPGLPLNGVRTTPACDVALATLAAATTATAVLGYVDDPTDSHELCGALVELRPPELRGRRRSWPPHPRCGCAWAAVDPAAPRRPESYVRWADDDARAATMKP